MPDGDISLAFRITAENLPTTLVGRGKTGNVETNEAGRPEFGATPAHTGRTATAEKPRTGHPSKTKTGTVT